MPLIADGWIWLIAHAAMCIGVAEAMRRMVWPGTRMMRHPALVTDVWAPLTLALPLCISAARITSDAGATGWPALGGPMALALLAAGAAMLTAWTADDEHLPSWSHAATWMGAGGLILLLGAAHHLSLWIGQCAFALGALLLWMNTPEDHASAGEPVPAAQVRAGLGMVAALACAGAQGWLLWIMPEAWRQHATAMTMASAGASIAAAAGICGPWSAMRVGGWCATLGVLFSLGIASLMQLLPRVIEAARQGETSAARNVAYGFGVFAPEAVSMIAAVALAMAHHRIPAIVARLVGGLIIAATAAQIAWRLASG